MGLNHPRARRTIDSNRSRTPVPLLGPIEEVSESEIIEERFQRRGSECLAEPDALRLTFSGPQPKPNSTPKTPVFRQPNKILHIRTHRRLALSPPPLFRENPPTQETLNKPPLKKPVLAREKERPVRKVEPIVVLYKPPGTEPPSPTHSQENPSLHLTSSSSGISKESTKEEREPKRRTYGQLATLVKCRQVLMAVSRRHIKVSVEKATSPRPDVKVLSPKAIAWVKRGFHVRKASNDNGAVSSRGVEVTEENKRAEVGRAQSRLSSKPPLYGIRRKSVQVPQESTINSAPKKPILRETEEPLKRTHTVVPGEIDLEPLTSRMKSWSKKCIS